MSGSPDGAQPPDSFIDDGDIDTVASSPGLRLRGRTPPVLRLSRRVLLAGAGVSAIVVAVVTTSALLPARHAAPHPPSDAATPPAPSEALGALPRDYADLPPGAPRLGPPLPGDLGRAILESRNNDLHSQVPHDDGRALPPATPARTALPVAATPTDPAGPAALFAADVGPQRSSLNGVRQGGPGAAGDAPTSSDIATALSSPRAGALEPAALKFDPGEDITSADPQGADTPSQTRGSPSHPAHLQRPPGPFLLQAGTVIPAALITGVRSDLAGQVAAQVTRDVRDSLTGQEILVPAGARLLGQYSAQISFGQNRVQLAWTRLILPDGASLDLGHEPAADPQGFSGLSDQVDRKWRMVGGAAAISTLTAMGAQLGAGSGDNVLVQALRNGIANGVNRAGEQLMGKALDVPPTLTLRAGLTVRAILTEDLVLPPWTPR